MSGDVGSIERAGSPRTTLEVTGLDKSAIERLLGTASGELAFNTFFNDAANQSHAALKGLPTADVDVLWFLGTTLGDVAAGMTAKQVNYDWQRPQDGSLLGSVQCLGSGRILESGKSVTAGKITHSSASSSTGDVTDQTTSGAVGFLQIFSVGSGTPTFIIEDSSDTTNGIDGTWVTLISFATQAQGAERKTVSGTVDKGLRARTTGSFSAAVFAMALRRGESVDTEGY